MVVHQQRQDLWIHFVAKLAGMLGQLFHLRRLMDIHLSNKACGSRCAFGGDGRSSDRASAEADRNTDRDKENDVSARSSFHGTGYSSRMRPSAAVCHALGNFQPPSFDSRTTSTQMQETT